MKIGKNNNVHTIIMPVFDDLHAICDFTIQTASVLAKNKYQVYLIAFKDKQWFITYILTTMLYPKPPLQNNIANIHFIIPLTPFPSIFERIHRLNRLSKTFTYYFLFLSVRIKLKSTLWCFHSDALEFAGVMKEKFHCLILYDCVDYVTSIDNKLKNILKSRERKFIKKADLFVVNSQVLANKRKNIRIPNAIVPQGFDSFSFTNYSKLLPEEKLERKIIRNILNKIKMPIIGYVGNLTYRLDFNLLFSLIRKMHGCAFVFTDVYLPFTEEDILVKTYSKIQVLKNFPNAFFIPKIKSRRNIKYFIGKIQIGMIPYDTSNNYNRYSFPMKLFEYFYEGKPVVSTPIEELKNYKKFVFLGKDSVEWKENIECLLRTKWTVQNKKTQRQITLNNTWEEKINAVLEVVTKEINQNN